MKQIYLKALKGTLLASAALLTSLGSFTACTATDDLAANATWQTDPTAVNLAAGVGTNSVFTRSNPADDDTEVQKAFSAGDRIVVGATGQAAVTYELGTDNTTWTPTDATAYLKWASKPMHMGAFYPAPYTSTDNGENNATMTTFTLPVRQNANTPTTDNGIGRADYMTFSGDVTPTDGGATAAITMQRQTARVRIVLAELGNEIDATKEDFSVFVYSAYKGIPTTSEGNDAIQLVYPHGSDNMQKDATCTALVIPGATKSDKTFLEVHRNKTEDNTIIATLKVTGIPAFEAGKSYTYRLRVGKDKVEIASVTVEDWETGSVLGDAGNGNEAEVIVEASPATHTLTVNKAGALTAQHITTALAGGNSLTITGPLNNADIATLKAYSGGASTIEILNLSGADLSAVTGGDFSSNSTLKYIIGAESQGAKLATFTMPSTARMLYPGAVYNDFATPQGDATLNCYVLSVSGNSYKLLYFVETNKTWSEANTYSTGLGGHLIEYNNEGSTLINSSALKAVAKELFSDLSYSLRFWSDALHSGYTDWHDCIIWDYQNFRFYASGGKQDSDTYRSLIVFDIDMQ